VTPAHDPTQVLFEKSELGLHTSFAPHDLAVQGFFTQVWVRSQASPVGHPKKAQSFCGWQVPVRGAQACPVPHAEAPKHGSWQPESPLH
jgi:hypothetical protein